MRCRTSFPTGLVLTLVAAAGHLHPAEALSQEAQPGDTTVIVEHASLNPGKAITSAEKFRKALDAMIRASREVSAGDDKEFQTAPYVAFSLKVARERIEKAGDDFRQSEPDIWLLSGINRIRGFVYDRGNDDLILVGAIEPDRAPLTLDDLVVALRSRFRYGEWPLVSIDPTLDTKETQMQHVRFEGGIRGTAFGLDLLAADYELKGLGMGYVEADIPAFRSNWDRWITASRNTAAQRVEISSRFWFYPINPHVTVREGVCVIRGLSVGTFTEVLSAEIDGQAIDDFKDPNSDAFAAEVSERFNELAAKHYTFDRLRGLQELVGLAAALEQMADRPGLSWWLKEYPLTQIDTPKGIPVARRDLQEDRRTWETSGGVNLTALALKLNGGNVDSLREAVLSTRATLEELSWAFSVGKWVIRLPPHQVAPEMIAPLFAQALFLQEHQRHAEALGLYDRILEAISDDARVWNNKGAALTNLGRAEEALDCFDRAIRLKPDFSEAWCNKGTALADSGRAEEALDCCDRAIGLKPDFSEAWCNKGVTLADLDRAEEALDCFDRAMKIKPDDAEAWFNKGNALRHLGRTKEALDSFDRAIRLKSDCVAAWNNKGNALRHLGRTKEALDCFDRAIRLKPDCVQAWNNKGNALHLLGRFKEALDCIDRAIKIKPDFASAWFNNGLVLGSLKRYDDAKNAFRRAVELGDVRARRVLEIVENIEKKGE